MSKVTYYVALTFVRTCDGVVPSEAVECSSPHLAVVRAKALTQTPGYVGALAFSRSGNSATGQFRDARIIRKFGCVPNDLSMW